MERKKTRPTVNEVSEVDYETGTCLSVSEQLQVFLPRSFLWGIPFVPLWLGLVTFALGYFAVGALGFMVLNAITVADAQPLHLLIMISWCVIGIIPTSVGILILLGTATESLAVTTASFFENLHVVWSSALALAFLVHSETVCSQLDDFSKNTLIAAYVSTFGFVAIAAFHMLSYIDEISSEQTVTGGKKMTHVQRQPKDDDATEYPKTCPAPAFCIQ